MGAMNRRTHHAVISGVVSLAVAFGLAGCSGTDAVSQDVKGGLGFQYQAAGDAALTWVAPANRSTVSGVKGQLLDGTAFDLSSWRSHVVVVNFWGSWCGPCQQEVQALEQVYTDDGSKGVEFLGVDVRDNRASADAFVRKHSVTYPSLYDESNLLALQFRHIPPNATPTTIVLDRQGRIAARHSGGILYTQLRSVVDQVLAEPA
jgi:thiol-disulfide isomerase/thioredoxin